jgi:hypothetical protein
MRRCGAPSAAAIEIAFQRNRDAAGEGVVAGGIDEARLPLERDGITQLRQPVVQTACSSVTEAHMFDHGRRMDAALLQISQRLVIALPLQPVEILSGPKQRGDTAPLTQQRQGFSERHLVVKLNETNHVAAAAATVTIEQVLVGIYQETGLMIAVQRTHSQPAAITQGARRPPLLRL